MKASKWLRKELEDDAEREKLETTNLQDEHQPGDAGKQRQGYK
jgi:hypothetical protein